MDRETIWTKYELSNYNYYIFRILPNEYTSSDINKQLLHLPNESSISTTTIELSCDIGDYLERGNQPDHIKAMF